MFPFQFIIVFYKPNEVDLSDISKRFNDT